MPRPVGAKDKQPRKKAEVGNRPSDKSPIIQGQTAEQEKGYNTKRIQFMQAIIPAEPLNYDDVDEMEKRFARYLQLCAEWDMKVGNQAAYAAIGIDKGTAWDWENRRDGNPRRTDFIKRVRQICAIYREGLMEDGKVNPVTGIFWQKNYDGLKDQTDVVVTPNNLLGDVQKPESLADKYADAIEIGAENIEK